MDLQSFKHSGSPMVWALVPEEPDVKTIGQLLARFLENFSYDQKPHAFVRNPKDKNGAAYYSAFTDWIVVIYGHFYFAIERKRGEIFGPHVARLYYKCRQVQETIWVAIVQLNAMWHSDERMLAALQEAVNNGELYQSEKTAKQIVIV